MILLVAFLMSSVGTLAHSCYPKLNSLIVRNNLNLHTKMKTSSLIERLCGPLIGIYCLDLFPVTNFEFYLFVVNCAKNLVLLIDLIKSI